MAKIVRGYNMNDVNARWLKDKAARETLLGTRSVSASEVLDRIVTKAREDEARSRRMVKRLLREVKVAA